MKFVFSGQILDADLRELRRNGELVPMEPQVFDLLVYLLKNRDRVVSKDDLIAGVWGGRVVSDSTLTSRINAVRTAIGDSGRSQTLLRTIPRKGIRFVGEVTEDAPGTASEKPAAEPGSEPPPLIADRPSIAVLPFENMSEDRGLELIVNGLAEDVIALLARVPGFFVIARASSFQYVRQTPDTRQVGTELGVRYVVTGSARSSQSQVRITVQLVEAESGNQLWAGRYDVDRGNTLDLQDEIARRIMVELEPALTKAEFSSVRRRRIDNVDAWAMFRQAVGAISVQGWSEETVAESLAQLRQAIAIDPEFALARAVLAIISGFGASLSLVPDIAAAERSAREEAERAVAIDPNAIGCAGLRRLRDGRYRRHRTRPRDIAPRTRARSQQCAGPHRIRRDRGQTGPVRRGHQEHQVRHALEPQGFPPDLLEHASRRRAAPRRPARGGSRSRDASLAARRPALWRARGCRLRAVAARPDRRGAPDADGSATHQAGTQPGRDQAVFRTQRRSRTGFGLELVDLAGADFAVPV